MALYNGSPVELDFVLPNIRSHSPGGKLPDPFRDAIPGPLRRVREPLDDRAAVPVKEHGPWFVLCDNEAFLRTRDSAAAHAAANVILWSVPPRSPDLNPIEKFWAWLRNRLRQRDLEDLQAGRPALGKTAFKARVRAI